MEAIKEKIAEEIKKRINKWPFWVRMVLMIIGTSLCILYHHAMAHWRFKDCPKDECPALSVFDNTNKWRLKEKPYMTSQQALTLEVWIWLWVILVPEWRILLRRVVKMTQRCLRGLYNRFFFQAPPVVDLYYDMV